MPGPSTISKLQTLSEGAISFLLDDAANSWPARGRVETESGPVDVDVYIRPIGGTGRDRPTERRFQNPASVDARPIVQSDSGYVLLLGLWTENGDEHAVVVAMDAYSRLNRDTRFSLFMPLALLQEADRNGTARSESARGEVLNAFRPPLIGSYVDRLVRSRVDASTAPFPNRQNWENYRNWNTAIAMTFFSAASKNKLVYLDLDDNVLNSLGRLHKLTSPDLRRALADSVRETLDIDRRSGSIFHPHLNVLSRWRQEKLDTPPPCLGLLAFFASVAEEMRADETFASTNYYGRLGAALRLSNEDDLRVLGQDFRSCSTVFWDTLNSWLEESDGERGLPTAFAFDRRRFVSIPISQALVREEDRNRLLQCFDNFGLRPGQRLSSSDMEQVLADWLPDSNVSSALKTLWTNADVKRKIAEIAALELEAWDGTTIDGSRHEHTQKALLLAVHKKAQPRLSFNFAFIVPESDGLRPGKYSLIDTVSGSSAGPVPRVVTVAEALFPGYLSVSTDGVINFGRALLSDLSLNSREKGSTTIGRRWKPIVVLRFDRETNLHIETKRVELAERHIVMCHQTITEKVENHLKKVCSGYVRHDQSTNSTVPKNWTLFADVRVAGICSVESDDLQSLVPVASTNIVLDDGLSLPTRNTWHSRHPPTLQVATLSQGECEVELLCVQDLSNRDSEQSSVSLGRFRQSQTFDLASLVMAPGDYRVLVKELSGRTSSAIATAALRLRNAEHRRVVAPLDLAHLPNEQGNSWAFSAVARTNPSHEPLIQSTTVDNWPEPSHVTKAEPLMRSNLSASRGESEQPPSIGVRSSSEDDFAAPSCIARGHHVWELPPEETSHPRYQTLLGNCKTCGLEKWFGGRPKRGRGRSKKHKKRKDFEPRVIEMNFSNQKLDVSADTFFDALCHIGVANRRTVANLVDSFSSHMWMPDEVMRSLSSLGHVELVADPQSLQITDWEISKPALNYTTEGVAFLSGYRTPKLIARLREDASAIGAQICIDRQPFAPSRISVHGIDEQGTFDLADSISQSTGITVATSVRPSRAIASRLPCLSKIMNSLSTAPLWNTSCQYFDLGQMKWVDVYKPENPGAYRFKTWTWAYVFVDDELLRKGLQRCADYRTIKHVAAAALGKPLIAFDETSKTLSVPLGAELPWLYERAVVLESGFAPVSKTNGVVEYRNVPKPIAELLWSAMIN